MSKSTALGAEVSSGRMEDQWEREDCPYSI